MFAFLVLAAALVAGAGALSICRPESVDACAAAYADLDLPQVRPNATTPVMYMHISKCAGTSMCHYASTFHGYFGVHLTGGELVKPEINGNCKVCNPRFCRHKQTLAHVKPIIDRHNLTFTAMESGYLYTVPAMLPIDAGRDLFLVTRLRDPRAHRLSVWGYFSGGRKSPYYTNATLYFTKAPGGVRMGNEHFTRTFAPGPAAPAPLETAHLELAKLHLRHYGLVLTMPCPNFWELMVKYLRWPARFATDAVHLHGRPSRPHHAFTPDELAVVDRLSVYDRALYKYVVANASPCQVH